MLYPFVFLLFANQVMMMINMTTLTFSANSFNCKYYNGLRTFNRGTDNPGTVACGQLIAWTHNRVSLNRRHTIAYTTIRTGSGLDVTYTIAVEKFDR